MDYENIGTPYLTCNSVDAEIIFVEEDEVVAQEQSKRKKAKNDNSSILGKDEDVELWVSEKTNKDCIKFFKPQYCISPKYPELGLDGYFLLLMTKPQIEFMKKFSERLVCVDRQKGENFEIVSLLILDDKEECLPCAFLFTNKVTLDVFKVFFTEIKNVVGKVETKLVLSEKFNRVANIWEQVMETSVKNMICSWDILKDWTTNLWSVETQEKVDETYKELEQLLEEKDINSFTTKCEALLDQLMSDPETEEFGSYFAENYASDPHTWACCYRYEEEDSRGYNQLEKIHSTIQYILHTKSTKKLNKALDASLDYLRNKIYDRLILINNGKVSSKLAEVRHRHKVAERMIYEIAHQNDYWSVTSRKKEQNIVTLCKGNCDCQTKCNVCNVCAHTYVCSCIDSVLKLNMCRHIHSVCISEAAGTTLEYGEVAGGQRFGGINSPISLSRRAINTQSSPQKKTLKQNQTNNKKNKAKLIYTTNMSEKSKYSLEMSAENMAIRNAERGLPEDGSISENMQIVQSDLLEVVGHEVLITNQEETYGDSHIGYDMDNEVEVDDDSDTCLKRLQNVNMSAIDRNQTIQYRKRNLELVFKTILNDVQNEDQLVTVENAVSLLQNDINCSSSSLKVHSKKRTYDEVLKGINKSPKIPKVFSTDGKPLIVGKTVILKFAK